MFEAPESTDITAGATPTKGLSRRQLVKAGVWAAPVVVLATASPAAAVSVTGASLTAVATAPPGNSRTFQLTLTIDGTQSNTAVAITPVISAGQGVTVTWNTNFPASTTTAGTYVATLTVTGTPNRSATIYVSVGSVNTQPVTVSRS